MEGFLWVFVCFLFDIVCVGVMEKKQRWEEDAEGFLCVSLSYGVGL